MVYAGPSKGCLTCRRRRVKCDGGRPLCSNCARLKQHCLGYGDQFDHTHRDETFRTVKRLSKSSSRSTATLGTGDSARSASESKPNDCQIRLPSATTATSSRGSALTTTTITTTLATTRKEPPTSWLRPLLPTPESTAASLFFTIYQPPSFTLPLDAGGGQDDRAFSCPGGFMPQLAQLYLSVSTDAASPLPPAVHALAMGISTFWMSGWPDAVQIMKHYAQCLRLLVRALNDGRRVMQDDVLMAVMVLVMLDSLRERFVSEPGGGGYLPDSASSGGGGQHGKGAAAIVEQRGEMGNMRSGVSRMLFGTVAAWTANEVLLDGGIGDKDVHSKMMNVGMDRTSRALMSANGQAHHELAMNTLEARLGFLSSRIAELQTRRKALMMRVGKRKKLGAASRMNQADSRPPLELEKQKLIDDALAIDSQLVSWYDSWPAVHRPHHISLDQVPESVRKMSGYGTQCSVYQTISVGNMHCRYCIRRLSLLHIIHQLESLLARPDSIPSVTDTTNSFHAPHTSQTDTEPPPLTTIDPKLTTIHSPTPNPPSLQPADHQSTTKQSMQSTVDEICHFLAFHLGDLSEPIQPSRAHTVSFPYAKTEAFGDFPAEPQTHGIKTVLAAGLLIHFALVVVVECVEGDEGHGDGRRDDNGNGGKGEEARGGLLREGQLEWIEGQIERVEMVFRMKKTARRAQLTWLA